jgi:hypothetical protein
MSHFLQEYQISKKLGAIPLSNSGVYGILGSGEKTSPGKQNSQM